MGGIQTRVPLGTTTGYGAVTHRLQPDDERQRHVTSLLVFRNATETVAKLQHLTFIPASPYVFFTLGEARCVIDS